MTSGSPHETEAAHARIRLRALGAVELRRADGTEVRSVIAQPKRLALLTYLAAARPRGFHRRDTLIGLFWPESTDARARSALAQALYFLRRSLGNDLIASRGTEEIAIAPGLLWCDAAALGDALDAGRAREALDLYRGELLPGFYLPGARGFVEWLDLERARLRRAVLDAASAEAARIEAADPAAAADLLRRALAVAPLDESVLRRLMALLDASGDRAGAVAAFDDFARRLAAEMEAEPAPETGALRDRILSRTEARAGVDAAVIVPPARTAVEPAASADPADRAAEPARALAAGPAPAHPAHLARRPAPRRGRFTALAATAGIAALTLLWVRADRTSRDAGSPFTLAIAPFTPATQDTALQRIARELVVPLSANLNGLGDIRVVEGIDVLAASRGAGGAAEAALRLARRLGASRVLYGTIVGSGTGLRVDATMRRSDDGHRVLDATVYAGRDATSVADSLTWAVLRELWRSHATTVEARRVAPPVPASPALATRSIDALRAFWAGERAIASDRWHDAADQFEHAFTLDPDYWFAYWRHGYALSTLELPVDPRIRATYEAHRFEFAEPDRLLIEASMADSTSGRLVRNRELTLRYPAYWQGWWDYGNRLIHEGPALGYPAGEARRALEQALALRPNDVIIMQHLFWIAAAEADVATMEHLMARTRELRASTPDFVPPAPDMMQLFEMVLAAARQDEAALDAAIAANIENMVRNVRGPFGDRLSIGLATHGQYGAQLRFSSRVLESAAAPEVKGAQRRALALTWAARDAWDSALVALDRYTAEFDGPAPLQHALRLVAAGEWLGKLPHGTADPWRTRLRAVEALLHPLHVAELAWLDGIIAAARARPDSLAAARARLGALVGERERDEPFVLPPAPDDAPSPMAAGAASPERALAPGASITPLVRTVAGILDASLAAFELAMRGETERAAANLAELERLRAEHGWLKVPAQWHPYLTPIDRLAAARWFLNAGRAQPVEALLVWTEGVDRPGYLVNEPRMLFTVTAYRERARAADALGRTDHAERLRARVRRLLDR